MKGKHCKLYVNESISLIPIHCLKEYVGALLGSLGTKIDFM